MDNKKMLGLAKGKKPEKDKPVKSVKVEPIKEKVLTPEEEKRLKAEEEVNKLLEEDVILPNNNVIDEKYEAYHNEIKNDNNDWLQDQLKSLSEENNRLRNELANSMNNPQNTNQNNNASTERLIDGVALLFNDLQSAMLGDGGKEWEFAKIRIVLDKMCKIFPFVNNIRRF